jgi:hypothetical protein
VTANSPAALRERAASSSTLRERHNKKAPAFAPGLSPYDLFFGSLRYNQELKVEADTGCLFDVCAHVGTIINRRSCAPGLDIVCIAEMVLIHSP